MARPVPLPRRDRPQPRPRHSYEGFVEKRGPREQGYRRVWAGLRGLTLAFYGGPRDCEPLEVLDLRELVTVRAEGGGLVLRLRGQEVTIKAESWEAQEMWRGFILTMAEMKVPTDLALLPGHVFQLSEALREEQDRRATPMSPVTPGSPATSGSPVTPSPLEPPLPLCFFEVTRLEAERLLERSVGGGNMVLRPGGHGQGLSVTTRQEMNGTVLLKHYKVNRVDQSYVIDVDTPHRCSSLDEVVQYFVESSKGSLQPLHPEYSPRLEFVEVDSESGEEILGGCDRPPATPPPHPCGISGSKPSPSPHRPALQPPGGPRGPLPPNPHRPALQPPGLPRGPPPFGAAPEEEELYMNDQSERDPPSSAPRPAPRRAPLLPHNHGVAEELARRLQLRRALTEE